MPEKTVQEVVPFVREQFEKGKAAYHRQNYDYAIELFNAVLKLEPALFEARTALRATQMQRAKAGKGFLKKMFGKASASPGLAKAQMLVKRNPAESMLAAEQVLNGDPNNVTAHRILAEAAMAAELPRTAVFAMELAFKQNPTDKKLILQTADVYAYAGLIPKAEALYAEVLKSNPNDPELQQALKNLAARRTMSEGGYEKLSQDTGSFRDVLKDKDESVRLEQDARSASTEDVVAAKIENLQKQLESEPGDLDIVRKLADLFFEQGDLDQALVHLTQLRDSERGRDPAVDKRLTEIRLSQIDARMALLDVGDVDYENDSKALQQERLQVEIESARQLAERYPSELQYRFELGRILFHAGKISEAIQEFQKAQANPHRRVATLSYLGQCFSKRGLHDVAVRTFEKALEEKKAFDDEKKEIIYQLGLTQEAMGRKADAIESFKQIYEVDIGFRDVGARVDAFYADNAG